MATLSAVEALTRLREGNARFVANVRSVEAMASVARRADPLKPQEPVAVILGCSDSRAPAETIFDQGMGDLFVIRVAGNIVAPSQIGSVEFAAERFGTRLVVVMGHTHCGAVSATIEAILDPDPPRSRNLLSITDRIMPAVSPLMQTELARDRANLMRAATRANVAAAADHLRHGSRSLEEARLRGGLVIVGAEYDIESGQVDFFDGVDAL
ncbi:MAG TPA: carbonic anhydrase [Polyangiaceae bacterium]|nr:carbonic anhydrase [Polyangiaceae bacterium]